MNKLDLVGYKDGAEVDRQHLNVFRDPQQLLFSFSESLSIPGPGIARACVEERDTGNVLFVIEVVPGNEADLQRGDVLTVESPLRMIWSDRGHRQ